MDPQTSEIIALLYESTQAPQHPLEPPALNPTGGVKVKPPTEGLTFRKDPTRPGGGVFVAHEKPSEEVVRDLPEGLIVQEAHMEGEIFSKFLLAFYRKMLTFTNPGSSRSLQAQQSQQQQQQTKALVNLTPLNSSFPNMNPAMNNAANNSGQTNVQVMNMLDVPQAQNQIEQYTMADNFLDGIPGSMLDWSMCHIVSSIY